MKIKIKKLVLDLGSVCKKQQLSLVTAESCTAGGVAHFISKLPEASSILERGYITYSPESKQDLLHVDAKSIQTYGTVSEQVVREMAEGALKHSKAQVSLAISGICGEMCNPSTEKGIVWFACAGINTQTIILMKEIAGNQEKFSDNTILHALKFLLSFVKKINK